MGTYIGSPWGFVRGKIGDAVGGVWKGVDWVRVRVLPTQRGTLGLYYDLKAGIINPERFSYRQFNIRRLILQVMGWLGKMNLSTLIYPVWEVLRAKRGLALTGINLFVKTSARDFWNTLPDKDAEYDPVTNCPDVAKIMLSDGDLETLGGFTSMVYDPITGNCTYNWDTGIVKNGKADDYVYTFAYLKPIVTESWRPNGYLYGRADIVPVSKRSNGNVIMTIPAGLAVADVTGFIFCRDKEGIIGFSPSLGRQAV